MRAATISLTFAIFYLTATAALLDPYLPILELHAQHSRAHGAARTQVAPLPPLVPSTPMEAALDELRRRFPNQVVIGFEELFDPRPESEPQIDLGPADITLVAALERVRRAASQYRVDLLEGGLVHVYPAKGTADPLHLLDVRIKDFVMPQDCCLGTALAGIDEPFHNYAPELGKLMFERKEAWGRAHGRPTGYAGDILGYCYRRYAPGPTYRNITVREALNLMALRSLELSRKEVGPNGPIYGKLNPISWKFRFRREPDSDTGLVGVPVFQTF